MATIEAFGTKFRTATSRPIVLIAGPRHEPGSYAFVEGKPVFTPGPIKYPPYVCGYCETVESARRRVRSISRKSRTVVVGVTVASGGAVVVAKS